MEGFDDFEFEVGAGSLSPNREHIGNCVEVSRWLPNKQDENPRYLPPRGRDGNLIPKTKFVFEAAYDKTRNSPGQNKR
jgi:hypothetical protein